VVVFLGDSTLLQQVGTRTTGIEMDLSFNEHRRTNMLSIHEQSVGHESNNQHVQGNVWRPHHTFKLQFAKAFGECCGTWPGSVVDG